MARKSSVKNFTFHYREGKFVKRFRKVFDEFAQYHGKPFKVLGEYRQSKANRAEVGPLYRIQFEDGKKLNAWPEEVCVLY